MNTLKLTLRVATGSILAGIISLIVMPAFAKTPEPPGLFSELPTPANARLPQQAVAGKSHAVTINHGQLRGARFHITLPGDISYEVIRESHQDMGNGRSSWTGRASSGADSRVVIGISGDAVAGTFAHNGKLFKLEPRADGSHILSEVSTTTPAPELDPIPVLDIIANSSVSSSTDSISADSSEQVIDVLVAYTPAVQALYGSQGADALIIQAVAEANEAYSVSKMTTRLNLVDSVLTNYSESGDMLSDLSRLRSTNDGFMDELHALRDSYGADLVSLIENGGQYCGLAYRMATLSNSFSSSAFSVVHHGCATGYYSFAHEIGHNQGAHHDNANGSGALFSYAYGYQDPLSRFRSVMAYDCPGGCTRAGLFSRGDNLIFGIVPTGDENYAANAVAIDQTASTVAAFRQSATASPAAPYDLHSTESGYSHLSLHWTDLSSNESGFLVERSNDGFNFSQVASLPVNTSSYVDNNLQADTLYNYRVRAWNGNAHSGYSNVATAATTGLIYPPPGAAFELTTNGYKVKGRQKVNLSWSGYEGESVDVYRNGSKIQGALANTGSYLDNINRKGSGSYSYKICEVASNVCSNTSGVNF